MPETTETETASTDTAEAASNETVGASEPVKMTVQELCETAIKLNNPEISVELRQKALTSMFAELCGRVFELWTGTGAAIKRLSDHVDQVDIVVQDITKELNAQAAEAQAAAEAAANMPAEEEISPPSPVGQQGVPLGQITPVKRPAPRANGGARPAVSPTMGAATPPTEVAVPPANGIVPPMPPGVTVTVTK